MIEYLQSDLADMTAVELNYVFSTGQASPVEAAKAALARIDKLNERVNAYCYVNPEDALKAAVKSEQRWLKKEPKSSIDGVPASIKDLTKVSGWPCRNGSLTSSDLVEKEDAPFTIRMKEAGAVLLGKTTTPEFGWKGVTDSRLTGVTRNPWNTSLTAGGSSGGAAVAAALNMGVLHQASDAGGSIRIPASFCGVFGIKPTFGYVPQWPASAMTTLSHLGPITRTVQDSLLMLDVVAKPDQRDWYATRIKQENWADIQDNDLKGIRVAYSPTLGYVSADYDVQNRIAAAVNHLYNLGAEVIEVDPGFDDPIDIFSTLWFAGAGKVVSGMSSTQKKLLDPGFLEIGETGRQIDIVDYMVAVDRRAELGRQMEAFHRDFHVLITPTLPHTAFPAGRNTANDAQSHWMEWTPYTYPFNLTQQPALSVPCGLLDGLPVGLQVVAARGNDLQAIHIARCIEKLFPSDFLNTVN